MPLTMLPQLFINGGWVNVPALPVDKPTVIERGYTDEGTIRPSKMMIRLNDTAAPSLNPSRATSVLYGTGGRAVPIAVAGATIRAWLETASTDPDQDVEFVEGSGRGRRWLDVEAQGPLFRIGQWSDKIESTMFRTFRQFANLIGYWPCEEPSTSAVLSTYKGLGSTSSGITIGDADGPPGAAGSFLGTSATNVILGPVGASRTAGFQVFWSTKMGTLPTATATPLFAWRAQGLYFTVDVSTGSFNFRVFQSGALVSDVAWGWAGTVLTDWVTWRAKCYQSGANVVIELAWYSERTGILGMTQSFVGTIDQLTSIRINATTATDGTRYAQIGALTTVADDLQSAAALASFIGYSGERAGPRFLRLLAEAGLSASVLGNLTDTQFMGAQKPDTLMNLIKEIAATEDGLVFDKRDGIALILRTRRSRYNQVAAMALNVTDVVPPLRERLDNTGVQNLVTITNRSGAATTDELTVGAMSTLPYPNGIGVFKGGAFPDVDVNVNDPAVWLPTLAAWYLARGTVPGPRFTEVSLEVGLKSPGLAAACQALEIGDRITIAGRLPDLIDLQVIGIREEIGTHTWLFTLTCIPGDIFQTGGEDSTQFVLDAYASTIITAPAPAATGTSVVVGSADPNDVWSTTSLPYPVMVSGERMQVTAATAPALVSGTWRQTLTVTRSVNGVVKAQVVGTPVHVFYPIREAW